MKVVVAGQRLSVRTSAKPGYIRDLASYVNARIDELKGTGRTMSTQSLALLAAMNIADELHQAQASEAALKRRVREKSQRILRYLDREAELIP